MSDDHERLLAVSERWRRLYEESQTELARLKEALECANDWSDDALSRWTTPDGGDYCCRGHWIRRVAGPALAELARLRVENAALLEHLRRVRKAVGDVNGARSQDEALLDSLALDLDEYIAAASTGDADGA